MATFRSLSATPASISYPFHAVTGATANQTLVITNAGNTSANWTRSIAYTSGAGWLSCTASGSVGSGCTNTGNAAVVAGPIGTEGLYEATITFSYEGPTSFDVDVDFYVFDEFYLPQNAAIRTATTRVNVNQAGRLADQQANYDMYHFGAQQGYLFDASLIIGTTAANFSWLIFEGGTSGPTTSNPFGPLYALSNTAYDSTTFSAYRKASGVGTNRDSSIAFDVAFYAPKHPDTAQGIVAVFDFYSGPKNPGGSVTGVELAIAGDWDVTDDSSDNTGHVDASLQALYQTATWNPNTDRTGGFAAYREDDAPIPGGFIWNNPEYVYPNSGFENDSVNKYIQATAGYSVLKDTTTDLSGVLVLAKNLTISPARAKIRFIVIFGMRINGDPQNFVTIIQKLRAWLCGNIPGLIAQPVCALCTSCGDADGDLALSISDAVFLIQYIFAGGPPPGDCNYTFGLGDADGDGSISISDAVYLIQYIFAGGPAPHCQ
jgi:hypothetical protein